VRLTAYVQATLTPQVLLAEEALTEADQALLSACRLTHASRPAVMTCADAALLEGGSDLARLARTLAGEARVFRETSQAVAFAAVPRLEPPAPTYLALAHEDLVLSSAGLSDLLLEGAAADPDTWPGPPPPVYVNYGPRALALVGIMARAEAWLEEGDRVTGAHAALPGFAPGALPIATQLGLQ
jgi:hypothetical protein